VQWLVAKAFNQAVRLSYQSADDEARRWAHIGLSMSNFCDDGGTMEALIHDGMRKLGLTFTAGTGGILSQ